jgi:tetratricopeptide (TPR) repeat protein
VNLRRKIDARIDVASAIHDLEEQFKVAEELDDLAKLEKACRNESERLERVQAFRDLGTRIKARRAFWIGELLFKRRKFDDARVQYNIVIQLNGDDKDSAEARLREIIDSIALERQARAALRDAEGFRDSGNIAAAVRRLKKNDEGKDWTNTPTPIQPRIAEAYREWVEEWERQILRELAALERRTPFPVNRIEEHLQVLRTEIPGSTKVRKDAELLPRCYAERALGAERTGDLAEALHYCNQALKYQPNDPELQSKQARIIKKLEYQDIELRVNSRDATSLRKAEEQLDALAQKYSNDPDIRYRLAQVCFLQGPARYTQAHIHLETASALLSKSRAIPKAEQELGINLSDLSGVIQKLSADLKDEQEIVSVKERVEANLKEEDRKSVV